MNNGQSERIEHALAEILTELRAIRAALTPAAPAPRTLGELGADGKTLREFAAEGTTIGTWAQAEATGKTWDEAEAKGETWKP